MTAGPALFRGVRLLDADGARNGWVLVEDGVIGAAGTGEPPAVEGSVLDGAGRTLVPGFVDLHVHGGGGAAFEGADPAAVSTALAAHTAGGTTRTLVSLASAPLDALERDLRMLRDRVGLDGLLGVHLEGPFLSTARRGAHDPAALRLPTARAVDRLLAAGEGVLRQVTIAPELPGGLRAIERFAAAGVVVAVGHTEADLARTRSAFRAGARSLTHAFNAMHGLGHREPGPVAAALEDERVVLELILDGRHVHPALARMLFRLAPGRVALVTDAMAAAGAPDGHYRLGGLDVTVTDRRAVLTGTETLAGSTLTTAEALATALAAGVDEAVAVAALTTVPAGLLGLDRVGLLRPGFVADLVLLEPGGGVAGVWRNGVAVTPQRTTDGGRTE